MIYRKYPKWGSFLKQRRLKKFRSAREFCAGREVGISYPQYSRYEAGDQLPSLDQAVKLFKLLEISVLEGILEWNLAQLDEKEAAAREVKGWIEEVRERKVLTLKEEGAAEVKEAPLSQLEMLNRIVNDAVVLNRAHLELFRSNPLYRDIFTYINSWQPDWVPEVEIAQVLKVGREKLASMLSDLERFGILIRQDEKCKGAKDVFYFPDDADFFELRNENFAHNAEQILKNLKYDDLKSSRAFRGLLTRDFSEVQVQYLNAELEKLLSRAVEMEGNSSATRKIYSLCLLLGERYSRPEAQSDSAPAGLTREVKSGENLEIAQEM